MKLQCVGGFFDGSVQEVPDDRKNHDCWRIIEIPNQSVLDFDPNKIPEMIVYKDHIYRIIEFYFEKDEKIKFLIPQDWTPKQAFFRLLAK